MSHPIEPGQLVLLHDPNDRPFTDDGTNRVGYHWSIWRRHHAKDGYNILVDWAGRYDPPTSTTLAAELDDKFLVIETHQPTLEAYVMAAIHMLPGQWHAMLDRKYPWDQIDANDSREFHR